MTLISSFSRSWFRRSAGASTFRAAGVAALAFWVFGLSAPRANGAATTPARPKNVLLIMADDLANLLGCYGDPLAKTPNIDALAARGVKFDRAYCNYPLCGPSRNSLLTGLYPNSTGIVENQQLFRQTIPLQVSLPQAFRQQGYYAVRLGKMYHYDVPGSIGTPGEDDPPSWEVTFNPAGIDRLNQSKIISISPNGQFGSSLSWEASPHPDADHTDGKLEAAAEWVLEDCAKHPERPFFIGLGFFRPHTPYVSPKKYFELYPLEQMPVVQNWKEDRTDIPAAALLSGKKEQEDMTDDQRRAALQGYYASISFVDAEVGRVMAKMDSLGLTENTVIVFISDHGYLTGQHGLWQKSALFEESSRVPLLIVAPGVTPRAGVAATPVALLDLYPTVAALAGITPPTNLQGQDLSPILHDPTAKGRGWALTQMVRGGEKSAEVFSGYSLCTLRWRYTEWDEGKKGRELYDHDADPRELTNLADAPAQAATVAELSTQLRAAVKTTFPASGEMPKMKNGHWQPVLLPRGF